MALASPRHVTPPDILVLLHSAIAFLWLCWSLKVARHAGWTTRNEKALRPTADHSSTWKALYTVLSAATGPLGVKQLALNRGIPWEKMSIWREKLKCTQTPHGQIAGRGGTVPNKCHLWAPFGCFIIVLASCTCGQRRPLVSLSAQRMPIWVRGLGTEASIPPLLPSFCLW